MYNPSSTKNRLCLPADLPYLTTAHSSLLTQNSLRFCEKLTPILQGLFGYGSERGMLIRMTQQMLKLAPVQWADRVDQIVRIFKSLTIKIRDNKDVRVQIQKSVVPKCLYDQREHIYQDNPFNIRQTHQTMTAPLLDAFLMSFLAHFLQSPDTSTLIIPISTDPLFHLLTRNIYLVLLREFLRDWNGKQEGRRLIQAIQIFIMGDFMKIRSNNTSKSKIKGLHLAAVYLVIHQKKESIAIQNYHEYIEVLAENFQSLCGSSYLMSLLLRVYLSIVTYPHSYELQLTSMLQKANASDAFYNLELYSLEQFKEGMSGREKNRKRQRTRSSLIFAMLKDGVTLSMDCLWGVGGLVIVDSKNLKEEGQSLRKIVQKILKNSQFRGIPEYLQTLYNQIRFQFVLHYTITLPQLKDLATISKQYSTDQQKRDTHLITYYKSRVRSPWQFPLQGHELYILFVLVLTIARGIDYFIPGERKWPIINLRPLANPFLLVTIIAIFVCLWEFAF